MSTLDESLNSAPGEGQTRHGDARPTAGASAAINKRSVEERLLRRFLNFLGDPPICFELWNGRAVAPKGTDPVGSIRLADRRTLLAILRDPQMRFGDAYSAGKIDIAGDLPTL